jgi:hypothetical protein
MLVAASGHGFSRMYPNVIAPSWLAKPISATRSWHSDGDGLRPDGDALAVPPGAEPVPLKV